MNESIKLTRGAIAWPGSSLAFKTGTWRVQRPEYQHRSAPCHTACPAGEDAQAYLALVAEEEYREAWELSLIHISEPTRQRRKSRMPSSA